MPANATPPRLLPVASLMLGASLWGVIWYPLRILESAGLAGIWLTLSLYASAFVASLPFAWHTFREFRRRPGLLPLLMLAAGWTNIAFVEAIVQGNVLRVLLLFYLSPLWTVLLGHFLLGEILSRRAWGSLALAMVGAGVMLWDPGTGLPWPRDRVDWLALSSGFAFALSNVLARKMADVSVAAKSVGVWAGVVVVASLMIPVFHSGPPPLSHATLAGAVSLGLFGILTMTVLVQYGVTHLPAHRAAVLALVELVAGAVSQQLLTEEVVTMVEWGGGLLILAGAWLTARETRGEL